MPNRKFFTFFLLIEYCILTLILSTIKRKMKLSGNFAFPTMLQFVAWLSFSVGGSLKMENCNQFSIFVFRPNIRNRRQNYPEEGGGVHSHDNFCPQRLLPMARSVSLLKGFGKEVRV